MTDRLTANADSCAVSLGRKTANAPRIRAPATTRKRRFLRRFTWTQDGECPAHPRSGHDAQTQIEDVSADAVRGLAIGDTWPHSDPRWPTACACGYEFRDDDPWQLFRDAIYVCDYTGRELTLRDAPVGAMYDAPWLHDRRGYRVLDGQTLVVKLPDGGEWVIDGQSQGGGWWTRTGTPPAITARPSILASRYHGWLDNGVLSDDLEGRTYG